MPCVKRAESCVPHTQTDIRPRIVKPLGSNLTGSCLSRLNLIFGFLLFSLVKGGNFKLDRFATKQSTARSPQPED